jgi:hypothetical protein
MLVTRLTCTRGSLTRHGLAFYWAFGGYLAAMALLVALLLGLTSMSALGAPKTVYVAPDGDDRRDCLSPATACASFDAGYHAAAPGDVVQVAGGSYPPQAFSVDASKTSELDVVVRASGSWSVAMGRTTAWRPRGRTT